MNWTFGNSWYLLLLLLLPLLAIFIFRFKKWRKERRLRFAEERFQMQLFDKNSYFSTIFPVLYLLATLFLVLSVVDFLSGKQEVKTLQKTNSVVFLLDLSNSMNTQDIAPSRLEQAKNILVRTMQNMSNDKVGIVVFAGEANSIMPLTTDYTSAEMYISGLETNVVQIQGTDFLKGIQVAAEKFRNVTKGAKNVVLISDGEDNEGNEDAAIKEAKKQGITITSVGIGTEEGAPIPIYLFGQLMGYKYDGNGETVISKRQTKALENMASSTGGIYIDGNQADGAVAKITNELRQKSAGVESFVKSETAIHHFQYFLAISLLLFFIIYLGNPKRDFNI